MVYLYSVVVGILSGLGAMVFSHVLHTCEAWVAELHTKRYDQFQSISQKADVLHSHWQETLLVLFLPAIGGLICGLIVHYLSPDAAGTGANELIHNFHYKEGQISSRVPVFKSIATVFTIASGGSGGKEGPVAQVGAGIGVLVSRMAKSGARARRTLLLAGTAAGLGAVFKAPLGGALTAVEMVYKEDIESDALIPCFISSVTAYLIYITYAGSGAFLHTLSISAMTLPELGFYILLGLTCFGFGFLFLKGFRDSRAFINNLKIPKILKPAIGGLLVGALSLFFFEVTGTGMPFLQLTIENHTPLYFGTEIYYVIIGFLLIAFLKIVATTLTIGSGGSAGIFGPSLFIGGMLGAAVGYAAKWAMPYEGITVGSYIVVGMGAFYAGVANAPMAGIIMICEMTGSYILLPPLIIVSIFTFIVSRKINFYKSQVDNRFKSPAHFWDMKIDVIDTIMINEKFSQFRDLAVIPHTISFDGLQKVSGEIHASDFVVKDEENNYVGMFSFRKIDFSNKKLSKNIVVRNHINKSIPAVDRYQPLSKALNIIMQYDMDKVAVVENGKVLGYIRSRDIFNSYSEAVDVKGRN